MKLFHRTYHAKAILAGGFKDGRGTYMTGIEHTGVWLSDVPLDINEGARGDTVLVLDMPEEVVAEYEWVEEGKPYREFLVPARLLNRYGLVAVHEEDRAAAC